MYDLTQKEANFKEMLSPSHITKSVRGEFGVYIQYMRAVRLRSHSSVSMLYLSCLLSFKFQLFFHQNKFWQFLNLPGFYRTLLFPHFWHSSLTMISSSVSDNPYIRHLCRAYLVTLFLQTLTYDGISLYKVDLFPSSVPEGQMGSPLSAPVRFPRKRTGKDKSLPFSLLPR